MQWTDYFDQIFVINLADRKDRFIQTHELLSHYNIPYRHWRACYHENGAEGVRRTMLALFQHCLVRGYKSILVFEDDVDFVEDPNDFMPLCMKELVEKITWWDMLYLGVNTHEPFSGYAEGCKSILPIRHGYGLHAVAYSRHGIKLALEAIDHSQPGHNPIDVSIASHVQTRGDSYCTYPLIATQRPGFSDIEKKEVRHDYIVERYNDHIKHLLQ